QKRSCVRWGLTRRRGNTKAEKSGAEWNRLMRYAYQAYVILQFIEFARTCRPDKAFTPHPA
ncbi:hypothetical protein JOW62_24700, partial [Escherichia coli]